MATNSGAWLKSKRTLKEAYEQRPPIQYVISGLFALPSLNIVYGPPGCLKSMLLADAALCVALGQNWLDKRPGNNAKITPRPVIQSPVMWIDFDNGVTRTDNRFEALGRFYQAPESLPLCYYSMPQPALNAANTEHIVDLIDYIKVENAKLVIIDNLATISGGKDENSSEMITVMQNLRLVSERTRAAIVVIHHSRKENGFKGKQGDSMRGFSGIRGAIDTGLMIEREPYTDSITITAEKTRDVEIKPFAAVFAYTHKPGCNDLETARFFGEECEKGTSDQAIESEVLDILMGLNGSSISQKQLTVKVKTDLLKETGENIGINRIRQVVSNMHFKGLIKMDLGSRGANEYHL